MKPQDKTSATRLEALQRRREILELRLGGASITAICERMGIGRATAMRHLTKAMAELQDQVEPGAAQLKTMELARLDRMWTPVYTRAVKGDLPYVDRALRIQERRAKITGIDAPTKVESTGADGGPIQHQNTGLDMSILTDREFRIVDAIFTRAHRRLAGRGAVETPAR